MRGICYTAMLASTVALSACVSEQVINNGFVDDGTALDFVPVGSSREQVLLALGSPSTTSKIGGDVYYYISQKRVKKYAFQNPKLIDQRVLAVYFDQEDSVERVANYGLLDGKVFDFITRTTPSGGKDLSFLRQIFSSSGPSAGPGVPTL